MPKLKSGRHIGMSLDAIQEAMNNGHDAFRFYAVWAFETKLATIQDLIQEAALVYYREDQGVPPDAPFYYSGWCVGDVLEGRSDWGADEVAELRDLLENDPRANEWFQMQFELLRRIYQDSTVWQSDLVLDAEPGEELSDNDVMCAFIMKLVEEQDAFGVLRKSWAKKFQTNDEQASEPDAVEQDTE